MSFTAALPEKPWLLRDGPSHAITVDFSAGTARPRWDLIETSFYKGLGGCEEVVTVAPLFHVDPDASPFSLLVELRGAVFSAQFPDTSFHVTHPKLRPVTFLWKDRRHVQLVWAGPGPELDEWGRWIYRLYVEEEDAPGEPHPVYLAFTCLAAASRPALVNRLMPPFPEEAPALAATVPASEWKLSMGIELSPEGEPVFRDLFRYGEGVDLPGDVYLEPLIVIRRPGAKVDIEFTTGGTILFAGKAYECDPGLSALSPLALAWRGVTDPKSGCDDKERKSARGFQASCCDQENGRAVVRWMEPPGEVARRASSFFFVNKVFDDGDGSLSGLKGGALIDPTVIHDQDSPPRG